MGDRGGDSMIITPTDRPVLYAVTGELGGQAVALNDTARVGEQVGIAEALTAVSDSDENAFIAAVPADAFPALPDTGWLEAGSIYHWSGQAIMVRQSHNRTEHDPPDVPALFLFYREDAAEALDWVAGESVQVGTLRLYSNVLYACIQAHVTQSDWTPDVTPALWHVYVEPAAGEWQPWTAYTAGAVVSYLGTEYECIQAHVSQPGWEPLAAPALWAAVAPPTAEWAAGVAYTGDNTAGAGNGDHVLYLGNEYRCLQSHTSISTWNPVATLNVLWALV